MGQRQRRTLQTLITGIVAPVLVYKNRWDQFDLKWTGCCPESVLRLFLTLPYYQHILDILLTCSLGNDLLYWHQACYVRPWLELGERGTLVLRQQKYAVVEHHPLPQRHAIFESDH